MKRFNKIISSIVLVCFVWNTAVQDYAFGLATMPGSTQPDTRTAMYAAGQRELSTKEYGPGTGISTKLNGYTPGQFVGEVPDVAGLGFRPSTRASDFPEGWENNVLLKSDVSSLVEAFKYFRDSEAKLTKDQLEIVEGDFKLEKGNSGEIPICRIEQDSRTLKYRLVIHKDFVRMWADIKKNDVWFDYTFPDGKVRTVSLAWAIFYRIAKHEMSDIISRDGKGKFTPKSHGHMEYAAPHFAWNNTFAVNDKLSDERIANAIEGRYAIVNDGLWMWFLGSYCFGPATQYSDVMFKDRALWFLGLYEGPNAAEWNLWAVKHNLPDEFPNLHDAVARDEALGIARAVNKEFWTNYKKHEEPVSPGQEKAMADDLAKREPYIAKVLPATGKESQEQPAIEFSAKPVLGVSIRGGDVIELKRAFNKDAHTPQIVGAIIAPNAGMNLASLRVLLPGQEEPVEVIATEPLGELAKQFADGAHNPYGKKAFTVGGALIHMPNRFTGEVSYGKVEVIFPDGSVAWAPANHPEVKGQAPWYHLHGTYHTLKQDTVVYSGSGVFAEKSVIGGTAEWPWPSNAEISASTVLTEKNTLVRSVRQKNTGTQTTWTTWTDHPYYRHLPGTTRGKVRLHLASSSVTPLIKGRDGKSDFVTCLPDGTVVPVADTAYDFTAIGGAALGDLFLDDNFAYPVKAESDGAVVSEILYPEVGYKVRITVRDRVEGKNGTSYGLTKAVQVYSPNDKDFTCIETQANLNDPLNKNRWGNTDTGMVKLEPGEEYVWEETIEYLPLSVEEVRLLGPASGEATTAISTTAVAMQPVGMPSLSSEIAKELDSGRDFLLNNKDAGNLKFEFTPLAADNGSPMGGFDVSFGPKSQRITISIQARYGKIAKETFYFITIVNSKYSGSGGISYSCKTGGLRETLNEIMGDLWISGLLSHLKVTEDREQKTLSKQQQPTGPVTETKRQDHASFTGSASLMTFAGIFDKLEKLNSKVENKLEAGRIEKARIASANYIKKIEDVRTNKRKAEDFKPVTTIEEAQAILRNIPASYFYWISGNEEGFQDDIEDLHQETVDLFLEIAHKNSWIKPVDVTRPSDEEASEIRKYSTDLANKLKSTFKAGEDIKFGTSLILNMLEVLPQGHFFVRKIDIPDELVDLFPIEGHRSVGYGITYLAKRIAPNGAVEKVRGIDLALLVSEEAISFVSRHNDSERLLRNLALLTFPNDRGSITYAAGFQDEAVEKTDAGIMEALTNALENIDYSFVNGPYATRMDLVNIGAKNPEIAPGIIKDAKRQAGIIKAAKEAADIINNEGANGNHDIKVSILSESKQDLVFVDSKTGKITVADLDNKEQEIKDIDVLNHLAAYRKDPNIGAMVQAHYPTIDSLIKEGKTLPALTPDFVALLQQVGPLMLSDAKGSAMQALLERELRATPKQQPKNENEEIKLVGHSAILSTEYGVITAGTNATEAHNRSNIVEFTANTLRTAMEFGNVTWLDQDQGMRLLGSKFEILRMAAQAGRELKSFEKKAKLETVELEYDRDIALQKQAELLNTGRIIAERGLVIGPGGNISAVMNGRTKDGEAALIMFIKASGKSFATMSAEDYIGIAIEMDNDGNVKMRRVAGLASEKLEPSTEAESHAVWYLTQPKVKAITHAHSAISTGIAIARRDITLSGKEVKRIEYVFPGEGEMPKAIRGAVSDPDTNALIIVNHGPITAGANLTEALHRTIEMEEAAEAMVVAKSSRTRPGNSSEDLGKEFERGKNDKSAPQSTVGHTAKLGVTLLVLGFISAIVPHFEPLTYALFTGGALVFAVAQYEHMLKSEYNKSLTSDDWEIASYTGRENLRKDIYRYAFTWDFSMRKLLVVITHETAHIFTKNETLANIWQGTLVTGALTGLFYSFEPKDVLVGVGVASMLGMAVNALDLLLDAGEALLRYLSMIAEKIIGPKAAPVKIPDEQLSIISKVGPGLHAAALAILSDKDVQRLDPQVSVLMDGTIVDIVMKNYSQPQNISWFSIKKVQDDATGKEILSVTIFGTGEYYEPKTTNDPKLLAGVAKGLLRKVARTSYWKSLVIAAPDLSIASQADEPRFNDSVEDEEDVTLRRGSEETAVKRGEGRSGIEGTGRGSSGMRTTLGILAMMLIPSLLRAESSSTSQPGTATLLDTLKDLACTHPGIAGIAAIGIGMLASLAIWRVFFPVNWHLWRLRSDKSSVRLKAVEALGGRKDLRVVEALVKALDDIDADVRYEAAKTLNNIGWNPRSHDENVLNIIANAKAVSTINKYGMAELKKLVGLLIGKCNVNEIIWNRINVHQLLVEIKATVESKGDFFARIISIWKEERTNPKDDVVARLESRYPKSFWSNGWYVALRERAERAEDVFYRYHYNGEVDRSPYPGCGWDGIKIDMVSGEEVVIIPKIYSQYEIVISPVKESGNIPQGDTLADTKHEAQRIVDLVLGVMGRNEDFSTPEEQRAAAENIVWKVDDPNVLSAAVAICVKELNEKAGSLKGRWAAGDMVRDQIQQRRRTRVWVSSQIISERAKERGVKVEIPESGVFERDNGVITRSNVIKSLSVFLGMSAIMGFNLGCASVNSDTTNGSFMLGMIGVLAGVVLNTEIGKKKQKKTEVDISAEAPSIFDEIYEREWQADVKKAIDEVLPSLSSREREILRLSGQGLSLKDIGLSPSLIISKEKIRGLSIRAERRLWLRVIDRMKDMAYVESDLEIFRSLVKNPGARHKATLYFVSSVADATPIHPASAAKVPRSDKHPFAAATITPAVEAILTSLKRQGFDPDVTIYLKGRYIEIALSEDAKISVNASRSVRPGVYSITAQDLTVADSDSGAIVNRVGTDDHTKLAGMVEGFFNNDRVRTMLSRVKGATPEVEERTIEEAILSELSGTGFSAIGLYGYVLRSLKDKAVNTKCAGELAKSLETLESLIGEMPGIVDKAIAALGVSQTAGRILRLAFFTPGEGIGRAEKAAAGISPKTDVAPAEIVKQVFGDEDRRIFNHMNAADLQQALAEFSAQLDRLKQEPARVEDNGMAENLKAAIDYMEQLQQDERDILELQREEDEKSARLRQAGVGMMPIEGAVKAATSATVATAETEEVRIEEAILSELSGTGFDAAELYGYVLGSLKGKAANMKGAGELAKSLETLESLIGEMPAAVDKAIVALDVSQTAGRILRLAFFTPGEGIGRAEKPEAKPISEVIDEYGAPIAKDYGPGMLTPSPDEIASFYPAINMLENERVEIYIPKNINDSLTRSVTEEIRRINTIIRGRMYKKTERTNIEDPIKIVPYNSANLEKCLARKGDGVRRIFFNNMTMTADFRRLTERDEGLDLLRGVRLFTAQVPKGKDETENTVNQAWLVKVLVLSALLGKSEKSIKTIGRLIKDEITGRISDDPETFVRNLAKSEDDAASGTAINVRVNYFLNTIVKLSTFIGEQLRILKAFWMSA